MNDVEKEKDLKLSKIRNDYQSRIKNAKNP